MRVSFCDNNDDSCSEQSKTLKTAVQGDCLTLADSLITSLLNRDLKLPGSDLTSEGWDLDSLRCVMSSSWDFQAHSSDVPFSHSSFFSKNDDQEDDQSSDASYRSYDECHIPFRICDLPTSAPHSSVFSKNDSQEDDFGRDDVDLECDDSADREMYKHYRKHRRDSGGGNDTDNTVPAMGSIRLGKIASSWATAHHMANDTAHHMANVTAHHMANATARHTHSLQKVKRRMKRSHTLKFQIQNYRDNYNDCEDDDEDAKKRH